MTLGERRDACHSTTTLFELGAVGGLDDGQLMEHFLAGGGRAAECAFSSIVERHGPMVLRVCRSILSDFHAAQDAFQATFFILARKARSLRVHGSLGPWLHQVAFRVAQCTRASATRRRRHEAKAASERPISSTDRPEVDDFPLLHAEVNSLPERFKAVIVLCYLEGLTHSQAARQLGWPVGTVQSRLDRGRRRLRDRLERRGLAPDCASLTLAAGTGPSPTPGLIDLTVREASRLLTARVFPASAAASLAREVLMTVSIARKLAVATLATLGVAVASATLIAANHGVGPAPDEPAIERATPGRQIESINLTGELKAKQVATIFNEVRGQAQIIRLAPEHSAVKKGDVVAELDTSALRDQLSTQHIAIQQSDGAVRDAAEQSEIAELALAEFQEGISKRELKDLEAEVRWTAAELERARASADRLVRGKEQLRALQQGKSSSQTAAEILAEVDLQGRIVSATPILDRSRSAHESAGAKLETYRKYTIPKTTRGLAIESKLAKNVVSTREAQASLERSKAESIERDIRSSTLHASVDGAVEYANDASRSIHPLIEEGATVRERQLILRLINPDAPLTVVTKIDVGSLPSVKVGQAVHLRIAKEQVTGVIESIARLPDPDDGKASPRRTVKILLDSRSPSLVAGMKSDIELITKVWEAAVAPARAIVRAGDRDYLVIKDADGSYRWRPVVLGPNPGDHVFIREGLKPGESVVLDPASLLEAGKLAPLERRP
jgi:HlyD family secretion protein